MVAEWMTPMVTSSVRVVVISMLFFANWGAMWNVCSHPKYLRGNLAHQRISVFTVLCLNVMYLTIIWAPFTVSTFKHNFYDMDKFQNLEPLPGGIIPEDLRTEASLDFTAYLDMRNSSTGEVKYGRVLGSTQFAEVIKSRDGKTEEIPFGDFKLLGTVEDYVLRSQFTLEFRESLNQWTTLVQDLVTSSFTYSLVLVAVLRKIIAKRTVAMDNRVQVAVWSILLVAVPMILTMITRNLANTSQHFALHTPEPSDSGYTMYSIICDVHITQNYVLGLFLEWAGVLLLVTILMVAQCRTKNWFGKKDSSLEEEEEVKNGGMVGVEGMACNIVLVAGISWAWPFKPVLVTVLYCIYGQHWTNLVCWLANMVVAIPVVFMPMAVALSQPYDSDAIIEYDIFTNDSDYENEIPHVQKVTTEVQVEAEKVDHSVTGFIPRADVGSGLCPKAQEEKSHIQENLNVYLGTDLLKDDKKQEQDESCVLSKSCLVPEDSESIV